MTLSHIQKFCIFISLSFPTHQGFCHICPCCNHPIERDRGSKLRRIILPGWHRNWWKSAFFYKTVCTRKFSSALPTAKALHNFHQPHSCHVREDGFCVYFEYAKKEKPFYFLTKHEYFNCEMCMPPWINWQLKGTLQFPFNSCHFTKYNIFARMWECCTLRQNAFERKPT